MTKKWNMIVDVERCDNCRICFLADKDEHIGNDFPGYSAPQPPQGHNWIEIERNERGSYPIVDANFMPVMCNHCDDAPCMKAAKDGAISKRADGIVIIDPEKSKGQKAIVDACPYGAVYWNEEKQIPQAWIFDAHLLDDGWTQTRAEQSCPTGVFKSVNAGVTWKPIFADYGDYRLYELPPNGQGIAALEMIKILGNVDLGAMGHNSAKYLHHIIEAKKLAYADIQKWNSDPEFNNLPIEEMVST